MPKSKNINLSIHKVKKSGINKKINQFKADYITKQINLLQITKKEKIGYINEIIKQLQNIFI